MRFLLARSTALAALVVAVVLVAVAGGLLWKHSHDDAVARSQAEATMVGSVVAASTDEDILRRVVASTPAGAEGRVAVHMASGRTVGASRASPGDVRQAVRLNQPLEITTDEGTTFLRPVATLGAGTAVVEVHLPGAGLAGGVSAAIALLVLAAAAGVAAAVALADRLTASARRALRVLGTTASAIGRDDLHTRIRLDGPEELTAIATSINTIGDRVVALLDKERKMIADVSHRLRTPLTALRLDAESAGSGRVAERIRGAVATLEHDVDDIIRTTSPYGQAQKGDCDAATVLRERMVFWSMLAKDQHRRCQTSIPDEPMPLSLAREDLAAAVDSLLSNVFRYTTSGTPLAVELVRHAGWITLVVEDGGPGISDPAAALRRGASRAGSTGLGLDIARCAVEATGGTIFIERGRLDGTRVRLRFGEAGTTHQDADSPRAWKLGRKP